MVLRGDKLRTLNAEGFESIVWRRRDGSLFWLADMDIDGDGGANVENDPCWQPETTLKLNGRSIDAQKVPGVVVPFWVPQLVRGIVLGCRARATNLWNMLSQDAVVHDLGPTKKDGEGTPELARRLVINPSAIDGGEDEPVILYEIYPGEPALIDGVQYDLQRYS